LFHKDYDDSDSQEVIDHDETERSAGAGAGKQKGGKSARGEQDG